MKIFFSAGEPSGDLHGANLIRCLRERHLNVECVGYGGPLMAEAGCDLHADLTALAVMWILRVLLNLHKFLALASRADRYFRHQRPDAVVLIDYPGFNWWIARRAKAHGIPVFYFAPPQIWAWAQWRVGKMRRLVDHVLCALPFEERWFNEHGCNAVFVGHPYFDEVRRQKLDESLVEKLRNRGGRLVTILPGSRTQEVLHNLKWFLQAATVIRARVPDVWFAIAAFKPQHAQLAQELIAKTNAPVEVFVRKTPELIHLADCCMAVSGSVSLELLYQKKPTVILYSIGRVGYFLQNQFRRVKYITLVNLLTARDPFFTKADREQPSKRTDRILFPEYVTCEDKTLQIAAHIIRWLVDEETRDGLIAELAKLKARVGHGGASATAADYILKELASRASRTPRPHFTPGMVVASSGLPATESDGSKSR
jgi:lipid-A-disaccharide synthase